MNSVAFWFYQQLRDHNYVQSLILVILLMLYVLISVLSIFVYSFLYGPDNFPVKAQVFAIIVIAGLVGLLLVTKRTFLVGYIAAILYAAHVYLTTLYGLPNTQQFNLFWFAIFPGFLVFKKSLAIIIAGEVFLGILMFELQCRLYGISTWSSAVELFAAKPELALVIIFVQLFSLGCAFMLLFMMEVYEENYQRSQIDHLTGLYNRHALDNEGRHLFRLFKEKGEDFYIIFSDLDRFKEVNDLFGHDTGDMVLREVVTIHPPH